VVTSDIKKGKHVYLICREPSDPTRKVFVPEDEVLNQVKDVLAAIRIPEALLTALLPSIGTNGNPFCSAARIASPKTIKSLAILSTSTRALSGSLSSIKASSNAGG
jgi:hypothetical protein